MNCACCDYWLPYDDEKPVTKEMTGECHRHAPRPVTTDGGQPIGAHYVAWPDTFATEFCGEHQRHLTRRLVRSE